MNTLTLSRLTAPLPMHEHTHAIIDRIFFPEPPDSWFADAIVNNVLAPQKELYPWLISLENLSFDERRSLAELIREPENLPATLLIHSHLTGKALIQHLADALIFYPRPGQKRYLFRYYDSRVFIQLLRMLSEAQMRDFCISAGINAVTWLNNAGGASFALSETKSRAENIDEKTVSRLADIGLINIVLQQYTFPQTMVDCFRLSDAIEALFDTARRDFCLYDSSDLTAFALQGLLLHPRFYLTTRVSSLISACREHEGLFSSEFALLTKNEREAIVQECRIREEERT